MNVSRVSFIVRAEAQTLRRSVVSLWSDAANEVYDLPDLLLAELFFVTEHVAGDAVADHDEDLAVARAVIPDVVGKIRRRSPRQRHASVALASGPVTPGAVSQIDLLSGRDR